MDSEKKINITTKEKYAILIVAAIFIIGITYAIQNTMTPFSGRTATIKIDEEAYGATEFDASNLNFIPILDNEVEIKSDNVIRIDFKVGGAKNNSDKNEIIYDIALNDIKLDCKLISPYVKWKLIKNNEEISSGSLDNKFDTIKNRRLILTNIQQDLVKYSENKDDYDKYTFFMWISDNCQTDLSKCQGLPDQTEITNRKISGKIEIELNTGAKVELKRHPSDEINADMCIVENKEETT